jgi:hypothetical protein
MEVNLKCQVELPGYNGRYFTRTENMSRRGILMAGNVDQWAHPPSCGDLMQVEIELPANQFFGRKCICCRATVVRVSSAAGGQTWVAVSVQNMEFRACAHAAPELGMVMREASLLM